MVTRLLALLLLAIPCYGQIAFTYTDQPFLQTDSTSGPGAVNLSSWWVSSDLTNGPVGTWIDKIQGIPLDPTSGPLTNTSNGIDFWKSTYGQSYLKTNGAYSTYNSATNIALGFIFRFRPPAAYPGFARISFIQFPDTGSYVFQLYSLNNALFAFRQSTIEYPSVPTNVWCDAIFMTTNKSAGLPWIYTNGVLVVKDGAGFALPNPLMAFGYAPGNHDNFIGDLREIWIQTNAVSPATVNSLATTLHNWRVSTYGP